MVALLFLHGGSHDLMHSCTSANNIYQLGGKHLLLKGQFLFAYPSMYFSLSIYRKQTALEM